MRVTTEEQMRDGFTAGDWPWRPRPGFNSWAEPCECGNDGICCDKLDDDDSTSDRAGETA